MKKELNNFIIESNDKINYFNEIVDFVLKKEKYIFDFFNIKQLSTKYKINILNYNLFKDYIINKYGKIENYIRGDTDNKNKVITILDIDDQIKFTTHKNSTLNETLKMILHEIVHACNAEVCSWSNKTIWFQEGLATNLSNQDYEIMDLYNCDFDKLEINFNNYGSYKYNYSYTIVKYILKNYKKDEIEKTN